MNRNGLPPIVLQMIESLEDKKTPEHVKFNYAYSLENIKECIESALKKHKKI